MSGTIFRTGRAHSRSRTSSTASPLKSNWTQAPVCSVTEALPASSAMSWSTKTSWLSKGAVTIHCWGPAQKAVTSPAPAAAPGPGGGALIKFSSKAAVAFSLPRRAETDARAISGTSANTQRPIRSICGSVPPSAVIHESLCTQTFPFGINKVATDDLNPGFKTCQRADKAHNLTHSIVPILEESYRNGMA